MQQWVILSFITMGLLVFLDIAYKHLIKEGYTPLELTLYPMILGLVMGSLYVIASQSKMRLPQKRSDILSFLVVGFLFFVAFLTIRSAQHTAPNLGYVNAIVYSSVVFTILGTSILFGSALSIQAVVGSILVVIGISLITFKKE